MPGWGWRISAVLLVASATFLNSYAVLHVSLAAAGSPAGCPEHGRPAEAPPSHSCCTFAHNPALPTQNSAGFGSGNTSLRCPSDARTLPLRLAGARPVTVEQEEAFPTILPLRI
jgi:hypothetical protein